MREFFTRQGVLLAVFAATVVLFVARTLPALEKNRRLADLERRKAAEIESLRHEALRKQAFIRAIESGDEAVLERAVQGRFLPSATGSDSPSAPEVASPPPSNEHDGR